MPAGCCCGPIAEGAGEHPAGATRVCGVNAGVTDGLVRDIRAVNEMGFDCFCKGYSPLDSAWRC